MDNFDQYETVCECGSINWLEVSVNSYECQYCQFFLEKEEEFDQEAEREKYLFGDKAFWCEDENDRVEIQRDISED